MLSFAALVVAAGCVTGGAPAGGGERHEVVIVVRNDNFNQATVFTADGSRRLGIVGGKSRATFRLEWHLPEFQLRVRLLAVGEILSQRWSVGAGETWEFVIPANCCRPSVARSGDPGAAGADHRAPGLPAGRG